MKNISNIHFVLQLLAVYTSYQNHESDQTNDQRFEINCLIWFLAHWHVLLEMFFTCTRCSEQTSTFAFIQKYTSFVRTTVHSKMKPLSLCTLSTLMLLQTCMTLFFIKHKMIYFAECLSCSLEVDPGAIKNYF